MVFVAGESGDVVNCTVKDNSYLKQPLCILVISCLAMEKYLPKYNINGDLIFPDGYDASDVIGICF